MKSKISFTKKFITSDVIKVIISVIVIVSFVSLALYIPELVLNVDTTNYVDRLCFVLSHKVVALYTIPAIILAITIYTIKLFDQYDFYFIRLKLKKDYHKYCLKAIIINCSLTYLILIFSISLLNLLLKANTFVITNYHISSDYYVINIIYLFWIILKNYILSLLYICFNYVILRIFNNKIVIFANIVFIGSVLILNQYEYGFYLIYNFILSPYFVNFFAEITSFCLNFVISVLVILLMYETLGKYMKVIEE